MPNARAEHPRVPPIDGIRPIRRPGRPADALPRRLTALLLLLGSATAISPLGAQQAPDAAYYSVPSWAPDGQTIAFESNRDGEAAVYVIRPDGSGLTRLTPAGVHGEQPNWAPDGRTIVFTSTREGVPQLYLMLSDGSGMTPVANTTNGFLAAFSPDGQWLLFAAQEGRPSIRYEVRVMRADGSDLRQLGDGSSSNEDPRWSVDGRIVFSEVPLLDRLPDETPRDWVRRRNEAKRTVIVAPDGAGLRVLEAGEEARLTRDRGISPDGRWRVYSRTQDGIAGLYLQELPDGVEQLLDAAPRR